MEKEIRIFDAKNRVLKVKGIRFDLLEVSSGTLIDTKNSDDLNPIFGGSNDWGVKLSFSPQSGPLEVYTSDPNHRYPGNTIQSLEGQNDNRIDIALLPVPVTPGGQDSILSTTDPTAIGRWVESAPKWDNLERRAVLNLISNYTRLLAYREEAPKKKELTLIAHDWEYVLKSLGIEIPFDK
jgi:hypothetical protein